MSSSSFIVSSTLRHFDKIPAHESSGRPQLRDLASAFNPTYTSTFATHNIFVVLPQHASYMAETESAIEEPQIISCTILVKQVNQADIIQVVPRLVIAHSQVILRGDASSVRIASLILALRTGIQFQGFQVEEPLLSALLMGTVPSPDSITVSTSRVPNFSGNAYRNAGSGYQFIGLLAQVNMDIPPRSFSAYRPMNVVPESNFILIFTVPSQNPHLGSPTFGFGSPDLDFFDGLTHLSPGSRTEGSDWERGIPAHSIHALPAPQLLQADTQRFETRGSPDENNLDLTSAGTLRTLPTASPPPLRRRSGSISTEQRILLHLSTLQPPVGNSAFHDAKFVARGNSVRGMIENHGSMVRLLDLCGLESSKPARFEGSSGADVQTHQLTIKAVFKACGWSESTFGNKTSRYQNAEKAARSYWNETAPEIDNTKHRRTYDEWRGVVYMWSPLGPIFSGVDPSSSSVNESERLAAKLSQKSLDRVGSVEFRKTSLCASPAL
ncbi:hypothetical protein MVEN_02614300 [Mycena venus]|uniref:Uncharacterized protein n=1 Tax=Mycena venus TaxID=2733690 RepID=A0A8H6U108_9AGAR|nr:hypothetical protein MVEN_02614300 [Mycena venus]